MLLAVGSFSLLNALIPQDLSRSVSLELNSPVLAFAIFSFIGQYFLVWANTRPSRNKNRRERFPKKRAGGEAQARVARASVTCL